MTQKIETQRNRVFQALADPTRRKILIRIAEQDRSVAELREPFAISAPAISKHLKVLEQAGLIKRLKDGKQRRFKLQTAPLNDARQIIERLAFFWTTRFDALDALLRKSADDAPPKHGSAPEISSQHESRTQSKLPSHE